MTPWMKGVARFLATIALVACTDAATRVAYDIEAGAKKLRGSAAATLTVDHAPEATPEGCPGGYTLQLSKASALLVWCQDAIGAPSASSHTTTYHLNYVIVPETLVIHKERGEHVLLELTKQGDAVAVLGLR
jgi:hypothetical protein